MTREEELKELAELEELERLEALEAQEQAPMEEDVPVEEEQGFVGEAVDTVRAAGLGAVEGVPFAKHALAAGEAIIEGNTDDFSESYKENLREWNDEINKAEEDHPVATFVGDLGASLAVPGGLATKVATFGAASALSRDEDLETPADLLSGEAALTAAGGAVAGKIGQKAGQFLGFLGSKLGILSARGVSEAAGGVGPKTVKDINKHVMKFYGGEGVKSAEATVKFAKEIMEETVDGQPLIKTFQSFEDTGMKAAAKKMELGQKIGKMIQQADDAIGKEVDTQSIYNKIRSEAGIDKLLESPHGDTVKVGQKLLAKLDADFKNPPEVKRITKMLADGTQEVSEESVDKGFKQFSLSRLHDYKKDLAADVSKAFEKNRGDLTREMQEQVSQVGVLSRIIEETVDSVDDTIVNKGSFKDLNRRWSNMNLVEKMTWDAQFRKSGGPLALLKTAMGFKGLVVGAALKSGADVSNSVAMAAAVTFNEAIQSPRTPATLAAGLSKLSNVFRSNPRSPYLKRVLAGAALTSDEFRNAVTSSIGEINLIESAVARTTADAKAKKGDILSVLDYHAPEMAEQMRIAIENDDDEALAALMDEMSALPQAQKFIEPGIGWNGKLYNEEDMVQMEQEIRSSRLPIHVKLQKINDMKQTRNVPQVEPVEPYQKMYQKRRKDQFEY